MRNLITKRPWLVALSAMPVALVAVAFMAATSFSGQVQAAPDANDDGMMTGNMTVFTNATDTHGWVDIAGLSGVMHKASWKDLVIDVSLECSLVTDTEVKSKGGNKETSAAEAGVEVRVLVDGVEPEMFEPGKVTFCRRSQTLSASFGGVYSDCTDANGDGDTTLDDCLLTEEEIQLVLNTTNGNAFNFVYRDLPQGDYLIVVQARITSSSSASNGSADAYATIGKGSAILEEVRFAKTKS